MESVRRDVTAGVAGRFGRGVLRPGVVMLLVLGAGVAEVRAEPPKHCRVRGAQRPSTGPWTKAGTTGEGRAFEVTFTPSREADASVVRVSVTSKGRELVGFDRRWPDEAAFVVLPVPAALRTKELSDARAIVETELFGTLCGSADPTLERALAPGARPSWKKGRPVVPGAYAWTRSVKGGEEWVAYRGQVSGREAWEEAAVSGGPVANSKEFSAVPVGGAVALHDAKKGRHAIVYVAPGGAAVTGLVFDTPKKLVVTVRSGTVVKTVDIDVGTGKATERKP